MPQRLILAPFQGAAGEAFEDLGLFAEHLFAQSGGKVVGILAEAGFDVFLVGVDAEGNVAGKGPGGGGPGEEVGVFPFGTEAHHSRALLDVFIALGDLVAGEGGAAAGAIGNDLEALIEKALFPDGFQGPPFGFDVVIVVGNVGLLHIGPEADLAGEILPHALIFPHAFLAPVDEGGDAVALDLLFAVDAEELFDLELNGETVGVPAGLAGNVVALHHAVAGDHILDDAGEDMADVGLAVGGGGAVVEGVGGLAFALFNRFFKDPVFLPEPGRFLFAFDNAFCGIDFPIHGFLPFIKKSRP